MVTGDPEFSVPKQIVDYLFLSFDPEDRLRLDDDLLLLFVLERVRCTDDPELDRLFDDLTVLLRDRPELLLLLVRLIETFPPL